MPNIPEIAKQKASAGIQYLYKNFLRTGFAAHSLGNNELAFMLIKNLNKYYEDNPYNDYCIYNMGKDLSLNMTNFAVYEALSIINHTGNLIATDPLTLNLICPVLGAKKYYYIYDLPILNFIDKSFSDLIKKNNVICFTRSKDYQKELKNRYNLSTHNILVECFDINLIEEIVNEKV